MLAATYADPGLAHGLILALLAADQYTSADGFASFKLAPDHWTLT